MLAHSTAATLGIGGVRSRKSSKPYSLDREANLPANALEFAQELGVRTGLLELLDQELYLLPGVESVEDAADLPDPLGLGRLHEKLFLARRGVLDVDGRVDPAVRQLPVEPELHVARALEFLEDDLVHPAARLDERGRQDGQGAAVLDVARRPEELFGRVERRRIDTTREDPPRCRSGEVVGPRQPGYAVEQDDDVLPLLDQTLDTLQNEFGDGDVVVGGLVEGRGDDLGLLYTALPVGNFLGALVREHHEEFGLGVVGRDGLGYLLEDRGLAGLRRRDDHAALAFTDGCDQVYNAWSDVVRLPLQAQSLHRIQRRQVVEVRAPAALLRLLPVHRLYPYHGRVLLALAGGTDLANYVVATPQVEAFDLAGRDVDVALALAVAPRPEKAEAVGQNVEDSALLVLLAALAVPIAPLLLTAFLTTILTVAAATVLTLALDLFCGGEVRVSLAETVDGRGDRRLRRAIGAVCRQRGFLRCGRRGASVGRSVVLLARRLLRCDLVDHLGQLRLAVLTVLLYSQLRGDLVQVAQALALQGRSFGHVCTPPLLFTMRKCLSSGFVTGFSELEAPPPCLGL